MKSRATSGEWRVFNACQSTGRLCLCARSFTRPLLRNDDDEREREREREQKAEREHAAHECLKLLCPATCVPFSPFSSLPSGLLYGLSLSPLLLVREGHPAAGLRPIVQCSVTPHKERHWFILRVSRLAHAPLLPEHLMHLITRICLSHLKQQVSQK